MCLIPENTRSRERPILQPDEVARRVLTYREVDSVVRFPPRPTPGRMTHRPKRLHGQEGLVGAPTGWG